MLIFVMVSVLIISVIIIKKINTKNSSKTGVSTGNVKVFLHLIRKFSQLYDNYNSKDNKTIL